ncbi:tyrosine-type recombinase/integrase [Nocardioides sp. NPDC058538]|uniref:tyrosine-type recombinase/integrase n=1 Tax=Nocardioides sp. NPDC058538 TaxID=3346542 RepID=UPI0036495A16
MATVERREWRDAHGLLRKAWRVRWRGPDGKQKSKTFQKKADADRFSATVAADLIRGDYTDPEAGKVSFETYAKQWLKAQTFDELTREAVELRLRLKAYPHLGELSLNTIKPSTIQAWLRTLDDLASTYRAVIFANVSTVFTAAVDDKLLAENPCKAKSVRRPKPDPRKVIPWRRERVIAVRDRLPEPYPLVVWLGAGLGLRQGEIFGLSPDDLDLEAGKVHVTRQIRVFSGNRLVFAPPKNRKICNVPLPDVVLEAINAHMTKYPPIDVTLPWVNLDGEKVTIPLLLYTRESGALNRNYFNTFIWRPALRQVEVPAIRANGCHALRHFYASTALHEGETIKALSEYLGHSDPGFTLRTYTHLMEGSAERTKRAIDSVFGAVTKADGNIAIEGETERDTEADDGA